MAFDNQRIGEMLVDSGAISAEQLEEALQIQETRPDPLGAILLSLGILARDVLDEVLADHFGVPFVDLKSYTLDPQAREILPAELARHYRLVPLFRSGDSIMVAMSNPDDIVALDELRQRTNLEVDVSYAFEDDIDQALQRIYGDTPHAAQALVSLAQAHITRSRNQGADSLEEVGETGPLVELVGRLLDLAVARGASDLHIEPMEEALHWRMRVDGALETGPPLPKAVHPAVVSRLKIMSDLDISETRRPQDGHFTHFLDERRVDVRVSIIPTVLGENLVLRLIDRSRSVASLRQLGLSDDARVPLEEMISKPHGLVLVTGPTGSGKTTLLYALLSKIASTTRHIVTIEDPVETHFEAVRQIQVNPKTGLTFDEGLRAILRHDPDVIMVGEIRDRVSAEIAIQAALTGHLLLSSLHTNDAPSAIARLVDLGAEPFLLAASLRGVVAQRLVRVLCQECRKPRLIEGEAAGRLGLEPDTTVFQAHGCRKCRGQGYIGRTGVFEVLTVDDTLAEAITTGASSDTLRRLAIGAGMRSLRDQALRLAATGITSLEEILRTT